MVPVGSSCEVFWCVWRYFKHRLFPSFYGMHNERNPRQNDVSSFYLASLMKRMVYLFLPEDVLISRKVCYGVHPNEWHPVGAEPKVSTGKSTVDNRSTSTMTIRNNLPPGCPKFTVQPPPTRLGTNRAGSSGL